MAKKQQRAADASSGAVEWAEEWVPLSSIVRLDELQVRNRLDAGAIGRYQDLAATGATPPPIKVARVTVKGQQVLYLVDGWHRWEANWLSLSDGELGQHGPEVLALVASMTERQARWEAASANMSHGVPLKSSELRNVFRAFIKAGRHKLLGGGRMSYRDMEKVFGKKHTTIRNWTERDFPGLFRAMGGSEGGNPQAESPKDAPATLGSHLVEQSREALAALSAGAASLLATERGILAKALRATLAELESQGTEAEEF